MESAFSNFGIFGVVHSAIGKSCFHWMLFLKRQNKIYLDINKERFSNLIVTIWEAKVGATMEHVKVDVGI